MNKPKTNMTIALLTGLLLVGCSKSPEQLSQAFFQAVKQDNCSQASKLIKKGVDINKPETLGGWSALHFAAQIGSEEMVRTLLEAGADPGYVGIAPGQQGYRTILALKPKVVAQAALSLAMNAQSNPFMRFQNPDTEKRIKDPKAVDRYERVCRILEEVTTD